MKPAAAAPDYRRNMKSIKDNWAALDRVILKAIKNVVARLNRALEDEITQKRGKVTNETESSR